MSTALNPYARFLEGGDALVALEATPARYAELIGPATPERLTQEPAPGKWSVRDVLCHLADTELAFGFRLRQTVAETDHVIQPFDQEHWAGPYPKLTAKDALNAFSALRTWNLRFIQAVIPDALQKSVTHPERGTMTFQTILETMSGHDVNHLRQIENMLAGEA